MYEPSRHDEITGITNYIDQQLDALRAAVHGLTEVQARETPCRSGLSVGGLVKHATFVMNGQIGRLAGHAEEPTFDPEAFVAYEGSFVVGEDETAAEVVARFDDVRPRYLAAIAATDPDAELLAPPAPWHGIFDSRPINARFLLIHQIEELARHAGHADIIREQLDGAAVPGLVLTREGFPGNDFFQPFVAAEGTLT